MKKELANQIGKNITEALRKHQELQDMFDEELVIPGEDGFFVDPPPDFAKYEMIGKSIGALVDEKNLAYGDSFNQAEKILSVLYPDGVQQNQYTDLLTVVRVIDKLFRIATDKDAFGESPWRDISGYSILAVERAERK